MLHITNGDSAGALIEQSGLAGAVLPWRDVLHDGPVPAGLSLDELRSVRARFLADSGWGSFARVHENFTQRDSALAESDDHDETVLWFEHDLYDQLQLIQLLDWFAPNGQGATKLSMVCIGSFPGIERFTGLGKLTPTQIVSLFSQRRPITTKQFDHGSRAWEAFRSPDPTAIQPLIGPGTGDLPFLAPALFRHLEQFPAANDGVARTERQILHAVAEGATSPIEVFKADQAQEDAPFMGDWQVWAYIGRLSSGQAPLVRRVDGAPFTPFREHEEPGRFHEQRLALTAAGTAVLNGEADFVVLNGIDRWLGGVHLHGAEAAWRWDREAARLVSRS